MSPSQRDGVLATGHAQSFLAVAIVFPILATSFVIARLYCRRLTRLTLGVEDWLVLAALTFYYCQTAAELYALFGAKLGSHIWTLGRETLLLEDKVAVFLELSYSVVITLARCSLCMLFIRIFTTKSFKIAAIGNLVFNIAWGAYTVFVSIFRCTPVQATFDAGVPGKCLSETGVFVSIVSWGIVCDLVTWALPIPTVWHLHLPVANKIALSLVFALGLVLVAIGIVRITTVYNINYKDFSYSGTTASNWAFAESGIAIMTVCGPMLRPLLDRLMPKSFISSRNTISQEKRKRYGQLQDHQVELVPRTVERSRALISAAADVRPHSEIDDDLRNGGVVEGREWYPRDGDVESGIHVQHCVTVES